MKKIIFIAVILVVISACSKPDNFTLSGNVKGLKKGKLLLQRLEDTSLVSLDSVSINGDSNFELSANLKEPQMLFLYLDKFNGDKNDDIVEFFAEKGEMTINTSLKNFETDAKITGSANQEKLEAYNQTIAKFNNQHLTIIKENFEAQRDNNQERILATNKEYENLLKRKYLYTVNYAINNKNLEVAPYLALSQVFDANVKYLDTIYNSFNKDIRKSLYGKKLKEVIKERKKTQKKEDKLKKEA